MKSPSTADIPPSVAKLRDKWPTLHDLDRAGAVLKIKQAGVSMRTLAKELDCSPSLLGHLLLARKAPLQDQLLARQGKISTKELVRRARPEQARLAARDGKALEAKRTKEAQKGCKLICDWLAQTGHSWSVGESIVDEARRILARAEQEGALPRQDTPPKLPVEEIIDRTVPPKSFSGDAGYPWWFAQWLARWAFVVIPDRLVRHKALNLALDKQVKGEFA